MTSAEIIEQFRKDVPCVIRYFRGCRPRLYDAYIAWGNEKDDLRQVLWMGVMNAVRSWRQDGAAQFRSYAMLAMTTTVMREIELLTRQRAIPPAGVSIVRPDQATTDCDGWEFVPDRPAGERVELPMVVVKALRRLAPKKREILEYRFGLNGRVALRQHEIADLLGLSRQAVQQAESQGLSQIRGQVAR